MVSTKYPNYRIRIYEESELKKKRKTPCFTLGITHEQLLELMQKIKDL